MIFLILGAKKAESTRDLMTEIRERGHEGWSSNTGEISFDSKKGIWVGEHDLSHFDVVIVRSGHNKNQNKLKMLAREVVRSGKVVLDRCLADDFLVGKDVQAQLFSSEKVLVPRTFFFSDLKNSKEVFDEMEYPLIAKPNLGCKGKGIEKIDDEKGLCEFLRRKKGLIGSYVFQKYFKIESDVRVFVVGKEVLGVMEKSVIENDFRSNASLGAEVSRATLTEELEKASLLATEKTGLDIAGVDLFLHESKWYVLEVNEGPQWEKFKEVTGVNPAKRIIDLAIKRREENVSSESKKKNDRP